MKKRNKQGPEDANEIAFRVLSEAIDESPVEKNPDAVIAGRIGGLKGGRIRAERLSREQRQEIAKKAAAVRWKRS
ncbi:MAG: hypothetical protein ABJA67_16275 [Chthonomonadales bacterium]